MKAGKGEGYAKFYTCELISLVLKVKLVLVLIILKCLLVI